MSGYPSKTGNPSGKGRWNNEHDDGYDDYEESVADSDYHVPFSPSQYDYWERNRRRQRDNWGRNTVTSTPQHTKTPLIQSKEIVQVRKGYGALGFVSLNHLASCGSFEILRDESLGILIERTKDYVSVLVNLNDFGTNLKTSERSNSWKVLKFVSHPRAKRLWTEGSKYPPIRDCLLDNGQFVKREYEELTEEQQKDINIARSVL
tara:strand:+ start:852 stop:1466 length:615 start_codon:yes stop_codon:yes gene_type:complete